MTNPHLYIAALTTLFLLQMFGTAVVAYHLGTALKQVMPVELAWMIVGVVIALLLALCTWNYITKLREALK